MSSHHVHGLSFLSSPLHPLVHVILRLQVPRHPTTLRLPVRILDLQYLQVFAIAFSEDDDGVNLNTPLTQTVSQSEMRGPVFQITATSCFHHPDHPETPSKQPIVGGLIHTIGTLIDSDMTRACGWATMRLSLHRTGSNSHSPPLRGSRPQRARATRSATPWLVQWLVQWLVISSWSSRWICGSSLACGLSICRLTR